MINIDRIILGLGIMMVFQVVTLLIVMNNNLCIHRIETRLNKLTTEQNPVFAPEVPAEGTGQTSSVDSETNAPSPRTVESVLESSRAQETGGEIEVRDGEITIHNATLHYRITCYGPPTFTLDSVTASGLTVGNAIAKAESLGLDGICAVSPDTPWYGDAPKAERAIHVGGMYAEGFYLVCDRTARYAHGTIDIYEPGLPDGGYMERNVEVYEMDRGNQ